MDMGLKSNYRLYLSNQWHGFFSGRVFCKKGCGADGETWEECLGECDDICYKDPVLKDQQWSAYIDRSPGAASYSEECFHACVAGYGYKFEIEWEKVDQVRPNRPCKPSPWVKPAPVQKPPPLTTKPGEPTEDIPCTSA
ncbi:hypothetical protein GH714_002199 [Hevea brasiliensis]|uniref:Uncharacterized protein n=1 Tax=Hevea brasiliensis TaxID=3981 RepID=A0A6A6L8D9_HEVBR|nr:hypothetical protein GH714_002199 [Hevea brasiliensis]